MKFTPHPYQRILIDHLADTPRGAGWAGMGMGKTCSTLTALDALMLGGQVERTLVLAPLRVVRATWPAEAKKWDHLRHLDVVPVVGDRSARLRALNTDAPIHAINYENIPWLIETLGDRWPFDTVVADESTRLKGFRLRQGTQRARQLARVAHKHARRWINLTGTPSPNGLVDLWGQSWFLDGGARLGRTFTAFSERWFRPAFSGFGVEPLPFAQEQIQDRLADICLSLRPEDWFDLEQPVQVPVYVELPKKAREHYRRLEREMFAQIEGHDVEVFNAAALTNKCLQLANGAAYVDDRGTFAEVHDEKLQALESIIAEAAGEPLLVAYQFKSDQERLLRAFKHARVLDHDPRTIEEWNAGKVPLLLAHPASAGHGLNLQDGGRRLVFFGHWWDLEQYQQIIERIGPIRQMQAGHPRTVFIYHILARDTVDEDVVARRDSKREVQDILMEAMRRRR